jgi:hypothetical protein
MSAMDGKRTLGRRLTWEGSAIEPDDRIDNPKHQAEINRAYGGYR